MTRPPQGWYPDPTGHAAYRRWDGEKWSDLTSDDPSSPEAVILNTLPDERPNAGMPHRSTPTEEVFPTRHASPVTLQRRRWRKTLAWTLIASALLIQMGAIGMLVMQNRGLEDRVIEQRNEIDTLKRQNKEETERREQEAKTQATAWCAGVSQENRLAVPELFMKYQRASRLTQEATQHACADLVAIAHAVSEVDFSLLQSISIDECSQLPGQDLAMIRGTLTYAGPAAEGTVADTLRTGDIWIDVALIGAHNTSPAATTRLENVSPGESRSWEVTLPFAGLSDIHSCRVDSVSWWPSNAL